MRIGSEMPSGDLILPSLSWASLCACGSAHLSLTKSVSDGTNAVGRDQRSPGTRCDLDFDLKLDHGQIFNVDLTYDLYL